MNRKNALLLVATLILPALMSGCDASSASAEDAEPVNPVIEPERNEDGSLKKIDKTDEQWKAQLTEEQYRILREHGTERAFTSELNDFKGDGVFLCAGCGLALFDSGTKFDSGTGWPSYFKPVDKEFITEIEDVSYGMRRVEARCARCDGHLGHVFPDGPKPTGLRYCINGESLAFADREKIEQLDTDGDGAATQPSE